MIIKKELRNELRAALRTAPAKYLRDADASIAAAILSSEEYAAAHVIFTYIGVNQEIATLPLVKSVLGAGKILCVPRTHPDGIMDAVGIPDISALGKTPRGLLEPVDGEMISPDKIDLILVPCLSCDPFGNRIGYGGGYYDRYLKKVKRKEAGSQCDGASVFVLVRERFVSMHLPHGANDVNMDGYFTETGLTYALSFDF